MGLITKVLEISTNQMIRKYDHFGVVHLYPDNTERTIKKLTLRGYKTIKQYCTINKGVSIYSSTYHNVWHNE